MATTDHTEEPAARTERFAVSEPLAIDVAVSAGNVTVHLVPDTAGTTTGSADGAVVEVRHDPSARASWSDGVNAMLNLFGGVTEQFGGMWNANPADAPAEARIEQTDNRLVVHSPTAVPLRGVPLAVTVHAPAGSDLTVTTSTADVAVTGQPGTAEFSTGSGDVTIADESTSCRARTGSGTLRLGTVRANLNARSGSGAVEITAASGSANAVTGSGAVWFGEVTGDVFARTGNGNLAVADARSGTVELHTGSGDLRIGIGSGVTSEVDVSSGTGRVVSELDVAGEQPSEHNDLRIHARTGTGNAVLRRSGL